ncbi:LexA family transcriptional regulator [Pseudomonas kurunegalensis]|uniref:LexA family transcriptional regulator n=1 Tax=Pseudomonas kurunegalensis TaxID=485880 RepID=UPI002570E046|nr:LexA family transcriptional regulator [Pseudomonas kurunegalensis]WJD60615.1 LexA family transcriptional regulator [Pseudomonas kurunegalensis]
MKKPIRTPLSAEQLADAKRLHEIYKQRVKESRDDPSKPALTQTEVGERCEWKSPQSTVSQYMTGKVALNLEALVKLSEALDFEPAKVSPTLAAGIRRASSQPLHTTEAANSPLPEGADEDELDGRYAYVPQYDAKAAAGLGSENPHVEIRSTLAFKREWLRVKGAKPDQLIVIYAEGESMWPTINDGDVLLVDRSRIEPADGQVFVLAGSDGAIVKRLVQGPLGQWVLRSDNEDKEEHPDRYHLRSNGNEHRIIGKVIWRGGDL